jgi:hypothetical protein
MNRTESRRCKSTQAQPLLTTRPHRVHIQLSSTADAPIQKPSPPRNFPSHTLDPTAPSPEGLLQGAVYPLPLEPIAPNFPFWLRLLIACAPCSQVVPSRGSTSTAAPPPPTPPSSSLATTHRVHYGRRRVAVPLRGGPTAKPTAVRAAAAAAAQPSPEPPSLLPPRHCRRSWRARSPHDTRFARRSGARAV